MISFIYRCKTAIVQPDLNIYCFSSVKTLAYAYLADPWPYSQMFFDIDIPGKSLIFLFTP